MNTDQPKPLTPTVNRVEIQLCDPCLKGEGSECHTPGCAAFLHAVDLPFNDALYTIISPDRREPNRELREALDALLSPARKYELDQRIKFRGSTTDFIRDLLDVLLSEAIAQQPEDKAGAEAIDAAREGEVQP